MKTKFIIAICIFFLASGSANLLFGWGAWGHKHINRAAVFALPDSMRMFYYNHIDFITEGAVVPDLRRGLLNDKDESPRHYIDIEDFGIPISALPKTTTEAYSKYDSAFLSKTGYLPWYIQNLTGKLIQAFKSRSKSEILFISAELAHYIGDAHMPLHTASNFNGQLTDQKVFMRYGNLKYPKYLVTITILKPGVPGIFQMSPRKHGLLSLIHILLRIPYCVPKSKPGIVLIKLNSIKKMHRAKMFYLITSRYFLMSTPAGLITL